MCLLLLFCFFKSSFVSFFPTGLFSTLFQARQLFLNHSLFMPILIQSPVGEMVRGVYCEARPAAIPHYAQIFFSQVLLLTPILSLSLRSTTSPCARRTDPVMRRKKTRRSETMSGTVTLSAKCHKRYHPAITNPVILNPQTLSFQYHQHHRLDIANSLDLCILCIYI